jgi:hypothetical protein
MRRTLFHRGSQVPPVALKELLRPNRRHKPSSPKSHGHNRMRALTQRETRTIRIGGIGLAVYLVLFGGMQVWTFLSNKRAEYGRLLTQAHDLSRRVELYQGKIQHTQKLMESFRMDPAKLSRESVMAQASAAIQRAAMGGGVAIGPLRESPARPSSKELGSIQLEAAGPAPALLKFVEQTHSLGYPLVIDTMQFGSEPSRPGQVKLNLTIVVLDFEQWNPEKPHV